MKKIFALPILFSALVVSMFFQSCEVDVPTNYEFDPYVFASLDENGGTWVPVLLTSSSQICIPAPTDASSPEFAAELAALKSL